MYLKIKRLINFVKDKFIFHFNASWNFIYLWSVGLHSIKYFSMDFAFTWLREIQFARDRILNIFNFHDISDCAGNFLILLYIFLNIFNKLTCFLLLNYTVLGDSFIAESFVYIWIANAIEWPKYVPRRGDLTAIRKDLFPWIIIAYRNKRAVSFLAQSLIVTIQRGNAAGVGTMPLEEG